MTTVQMRVQRRTMGTLAASQICGGIGAFACIAVATLLAKAIVGSDSLAGLPQTSRELGGAAAAYAIGRISAARGRRAGLASAYLTCALGGLLCVLAGVVGSFIALMVGMTLVGAGLAGTWQARFAATDLAPPHHSARALSVVVWATMVGAAAGPATAGPAGDAVATVGLPRLTGGFLVGALGALVAAAWVAVRMRPDPLLVARQLEGSGGSSPARHPRRVLAVLRGHPQAVVGIAAIAAAHATMIAVMVIAPLQMGEGGVALGRIGAVIGAHIACMYALSPLVGWGTDVAGPRPVLLAGAALLLAGVGLSGTADGSLPLLTFGLCLVGLGWSCTLIAGSAVVTAALPLAERPVVQGFSDLVMGVAGGGAGAIGGLIVGAWGFTTLSVAEAVAVCVVAAAALATRPPPPSRARQSANSGTTPAHSVTVGTDRLPAGHVDHPEPDEDDESGN